VSMTRFATSWRSATDAPAYPYAHDTNGILQQKQKASCGTVYEGM